MLRPELLGPARRMERVAEADEAGDARLVRDHARDAASERLAADDEGRAGAAAERPGRRDRVEPRLPQDGRPVRRAAASAGPPRRHVRELETGDAESLRGRAPGQPIHERRVHGRAGAVREDEADGRRGRTVQEEVRGFHGGILRPGCPLPFVPRGEPSTDPFVILFRVIESALRAQPLPLTFDRSAGILLSKNSERRP